MRRRLGLRDGGAARLRRAARSRRGLVDVRPRRIYCRRHGNSRIAAAALVAGRLTAVLGGIVVVVGIIFAFKSAWYPDWYALFRVVARRRRGRSGSAAACSSRSSACGPSGARPERDSDARPSGRRSPARRSSRRQAESCSLMGIAMMINTNWGWGKFWVVAGLVGYAITFVTGIAVLSPLARKVDALIAEQGPGAPETQATIERILLDRARRHRRAAARRRRHGRRSRSARRSQKPVRLASVPVRSGSARSHAHRVVPEST